jgi:hypothetical protein
MDDVEAAEIELELRAMILDAGLTWVLEEVDEALAEGFVEVTDKPSVRTSKARDIGKVEALSSGTLNRRRDEKIRPYTPTERTFLLIDAIRRAVVETAALEQQLTSSLKELADADEVRFAVEPDDRRSEFTVGGDERMSRADELAAALTGLKEGELA